MRNGGCDGIVGEQRGGGVDSSGCLAWYKSGGSLSAKMSRDELWRHNV